VWLEDPLFEIGVGMNNNDFVKYISYNKLHITKTIIDVIKVLTYQDLVGHELGYRNNTTLPNRLRIWAIPILVKYFEETRLDTFDIIYKDIEVIILREKRKKGVMKNALSHV
jgi:hypothetical protein